MNSLICRFEARSWTRGIAWVQIVVFSVGLLLAAGGLMVLLVEGKDAVDKVTQENPDQKNGAFIDWNLTMPSEYLKLVITLAICVVILFIGNIFGVFLIKGATESKSRYLKWWIVYSVICFAWFILTEILIDSVDKLFAFLRRSIFCSVYGFSFFVVVTSIKEIEADEELKRVQVAVSGSGF